MKGRHYYLNVRYIQDFQESLLKFLIWVCILIKSCGESGFVLVQLDPGSKGLCMSRQLFNHKNVIVRVIGLTLERSLR